ARSTVVAHHEVVIWRNGDLLGEIAGALSATWANFPIPLERLAVDDRDALIDRERVARARDHALDEVLVGLVARRLRAGFAVLDRDPALVTLERPLRRVKDDDVAGAGIGAQPGED